MTAYLCDSHVHLNDRAFDGDLEAVLERAFQAGVQRLVNVGCDERTSVLALEQAAKHPGLFATVGLHPHDARLLSPRTIDFFDSLAADPRVVAIGETGLDYHYLHSPAEKQKEVLALHLDLADTLRLPAVIHCRSAYPDLLEILRGRCNTDHAPWLVHCFSGGSADLEALIALDCYFSVGGTVTFRNFGKQDLIRRIPAGRLLLETDAPYLAPIPHRGKRNEPAWLALTAGAVAEIRGLSPEELSEQTTANCNRLFGLDRAAQAPAHPGQ
jgi:TatD DNase family protein